MPLAFLIAFYGLQLLSRIILQSHFLYGDDLEIQHYAHTLAVAYPPRLPLYNWLLYLSCQLFSHELLAYYLVRYSLLSLFGFFVYQSGRLISQQAMTAWVYVLALGLSTNFFLNNFTHTNTALMSCSLLLALFFYWQRSEVSQRRYLSTLTFACAFSLALLSKYTAWLYILLFLFSAHGALGNSQRHLRRSIYQGLSVALVCVSPYFYWFITHASSMLSKHKVVVKSQFSIGNALTFPGSALVVLGLFLFVYTLSYYQSFSIAYKRLSRLKDDVTYCFLKRFSTSYLILMTTLTLSGHLRLRRYYQLPFLFMIEIFLLYLIQDVASKKEHRRFIALASIIIVIESLVVVMQHPSKEVVNLLHSI